jgi:hypothetical protein
MSPSTVLVTGASRFIGGQLAPGSPPIPPSIVFSPSTPCRRARSCRDGWGAPNRPYRPAQSIDHQGDL